MSAAIFIAGLITWAICASKLQESSVRFGALLGANESVLGQIESLVVTAIVAIGITGAITGVLVVLLGLMRTAQRSMLWGGCCCDCSEWR